MGKRQQSLVDRYLAETFDYNGELLTRGEIIHRLHLAGGTFKEIDMFLFGLDLRKELDQKHNQERQEAEMQLKACQANLRAAINELEKREAPNA